MCKNIGILHLSDFHINQSNRTNIQKLIKLLYADLEKLLEDTDAEIDMICITGDLIKTGQNHNDETDLALNTIVMPLMEHYQLTEDNIFIVAGNHEVDTTKIQKYTEEGLAKLLVSSDEIDNFLNDIDKSALDRINYFNDFTEVFSGKPSFKNELSSAHIVQIKGRKIGIALVNSAWRSSGKGYIEKNTMILGKKQLIDCLDAIDDTDIKICLMHHPLDWLIDADKFEVERCINDFDIVLNGHIHSLDSKAYSSFNGQTLFNTSGKFDNSSDIFNGYSLLVINPMNYHCDVYLRQYHPHPRNCYDKAIQLSKDGMLSANLDAKDETQIVAYNIIQSIREGFLQYSNSFFVSNVADGFISKSFDDIFVAPTLNRFSEYEKETMLEKEDYLNNSKNEKDNGKITIEELCSNADNIFLYGKKEIGKTTILHFFVKVYLSKFLEYGNVPVIIDCSKQDFIGHKPIEKAMLSFLHDFAIEDFQISLEHIEMLCSKNKMIIMFDNFETATDRQINKINDFINKYKSNRYFFSCVEAVRAPLNEHIVITACNYVTIYIRSMSKHQIRIMTKNLNNTPNNSEASLLDKMMLCFKSTSLPKTPFVVSLILSICKDNMEFIPVNEAVVMENFLEMLLEKGSADESRRSNYDFRNKEDFLIYLVSYMNKNDRFYLNNQEFQELLFSYHQKKLFDLNDTKFNQIFFDKGVLVRTTDFITFRYSCMVEYYLAKKAINDPEFLNYILGDERYLNFSGELALYTGLRREDVNVLNAIEPNYLKYIKEKTHLLETLDNYNIDLDFSIEADKLNDKVASSRLSIEESDDITDSDDASERKAPENISKNNNFESDEKFLSTLFLYGTFLKNSELMDGEVKNKIFKNYMLGLLIWLSQMKIETEEASKQIILKRIEKSTSKEETEKITRQIVQIVQDIIKISLPTMVENIALENIGSVKLKSVMQSFIDSADKESFEKFISLFLYADLRINGSIKYIQDYVRSADNKDFLKIIFFKLLYYYRFRYFSSDYDNTLENLLADVNLKLKNENKFDKSNLLKNIRQMERESPQNMWDDEF